MVDAMWGETVGGPPELSVVVPMYNEEHSLHLLFDRLRPVLDGLGADYETLVVDDGSTDLTPALLEKARRGWPQLRIIRLRVNAGHQAAISAGLLRARGDYVVTIDADCQDPPETIPEMLATARERQVDVVYGVRSDRSSDTVFKRVSAHLFYSAFRKASSSTAASHAGDFRLMSRATVNVVNSLPEHSRVLRFVVPALGFPSAEVAYVREARSAGTSKYSLARMVALSVDSFTTFSTAPLRVATGLGIVGALFAVVFAVFVVANRLLGNPVAGWASTVLVVVIASAVQLLCLGVLGEYIARMYAQMQGRPTHFVAYDSLADPIGDGSVDVAAPRQASVGEQRRR